MARASSTSSTTPAASPSTCGARRRWARPHRTATRRLARRRRPRRTCRGWRRRRLQLRCARAVLYNPAYWWREITLGGAASLPPSVGINWFFEAYYQGAPEHELGPIAPLPDARRHHAAPRPVPAARRGRPRKRGRRARRRPPPPAASRAQLRGAAAEASASRVVVRFDWEALVGSVYAGGWGTSSTQLETAMTLTSSSVRRGGAGTHEVERLGRFCDAEEGRRGAACSSPSRRARS